MIHFLEGQLPFLEKNDPAPGLYLVGTPIGNASDLSIRALYVLSRVDYILCEDTRNTKILLDLYKIKKPLHSYYEYNERQKIPMILEDLAQGSKIALVSDAGMPLISDPGYKLVHACLEKGMNVTAVPGPSAAITGLILSGLPTDQFYFVGFLPLQKRAEKIQALKDIRGSLVFYEAPSRLEETLKDLLSILGDRPASLARELTKKFEEIQQGTLSSLLKKTPRGECVLIVHGAEPTEPIDHQIQEALEICMPSLSVKDASALVASLLKISRSRVYDVALKMKS